MRIAINFLLIASSFLHTINASSLRQAAKATARTPEEAHVDNKPETLGNALGRPAWVVYPESYNASATDDSNDEDQKRWPLILMIHGGGSDSYYHDHFLGVSARVTSHGFVALLPNATVNSAGHFWNGIECCDFDHTHTDDVGYLLALVQEALDTLDIDGKRVYIIGHSNGGAMSQILACQHADYFAAIASICPGEIPSPCEATHPVSVLEVCAEEDPIVKLPLCQNILGNWTRNNDCPSTPTFTASRDYDCDPNRPVGDNTDGHGFQYNQWHGANCELPGNETDVTGYSCVDNSEVEFWWMKGAAHNPGFSNQWSDDVIAWLLSKPFVEAEST